MWRLEQRASRQFLLTLGFSSLVSIGFLAARIVSTGTFHYSFLLWNLWLAWLPLLFSWVLIMRLPTTRWMTWQNIVLTLLWLGFLPNAFYIASDLIHLQATGSISLLFDLCMFLSFTFNGFVLGFTSLYLMHQQFRRYGLRASYALVAGVLLLCSYAIYLGRNLRWNSWDIIFSPAGLIFDVSDSFINPSAHPRAFTTTLMFFVLLTSIYGVTYRLVVNLRGTEKKTAR